MSEYQYYEFLSIDAPLDAKQMAALRALSTRADITSTSFTNVYQWGDFKGSPEKLMEQYFDAHVYVANWGTQILMLRLPKALLSKETLAPYCIDEGMHGWTKGAHLIIEWRRDEEESSGEWVEGEGWLARLLPIREELERGDYRALYLGWLYAARFDEVPAETLEPPVPAGLGKLTAAQRSLVEFLDIDQDFLAAAAQESPAVVDQTDAPDAMAQWVAAVPAQETQQYLLLLLQGKAKQAERALRQKYRLAQQAQISPATKESVPRRRSLAALHTLAEDAETKRLERQKKQNQRRLEKQQQQREHYLVTLAEEFDRYWQEVESLVAQQIASAYDRARDLLVDLSDAYKLKDEHDTFLKKITQFRKVHSRRSALLRRLDKAGLRAPTERG